MLLAPCLVLSLAAEPVQPSLFVTSDHTLNQYNAFTGALIGQNQTITPGAPQGNALYGLAVGPNGNVFASNSTGGVLEFNGATGTLINNNYFVETTGNYTGLTFGPDGNLYVASGSLASGSTIAQYNGNTGALINSAFASVPGVIGASAFAFGPNGDLFACLSLVSPSSANGHKILEFDGQTGAFVKAFVDATVTPSPLNYPTGLTWDSAGNLYVTNSSPAAVLKYDGTTGAYIGIFASGQGMNEPYGLQFGPDGNLYVVSGGTQQVLKFSGSTGAFLGVVASVPSAAELVFTPGLGTNSILMGSAGGSSSVELVDGGVWTAAANDSFLHISSGSAGGVGNALVAFTVDPLTGTGTRSGTLVIAGLTVTVTQAGTNYTATSTEIPLVVCCGQGLSALSVAGTAVDTSGNVYFTNGNLLQQWNAASQQVNTLIPSGLSGPTGVAVDGAGSVYIADTGNNAIKEWNVNTQNVTELVASGLSHPGGVAVDNAGNVYFADTGNNAVKELVAATQKVISLVSSGLSGPLGVAVDFQGNVYIADSGNYAIKELPAASQSVKTLMNTNITNGPDEPAMPDAVAVDGSGNVYVAYINNGAIQELQVSTGQTLNLIPSYGLGYTFFVAVDPSGNLYIGISDVSNGLQEIPNAFVGPPSLTETSAAGSDQLLSVVPATQSLSGVYAPGSSQSWLTIGSINDGVVSFSFTANTGAVSRTANIYLLRQPITVTQQNGTVIQTISFNPPGTLTLGTQPGPLSATASPSGYTVMFTSNTPSVCTVSGTTLTLLTSGVCSITATQPGDATYAPAQPVTQLITVLGMAQTINFGALNGVTLPASPIKVSATASSGLQVNFASNDLAVCTVGLVSIPHGLSGWYIVPQSPGTCSITASQGGNSTWAAATPVTQTFTVTGEAQTITFFLPLGSWTLGMTPSPTLTATASSGLPVRLTSNTPAVCTVSGTKVTLLTDGACSITASQDGNSTFAPATPVTEIITVIGKAQTITFATLSNVPVSAAPFKVFATASSSLPVTLTSNTPTICTVGFEIIPLGPSNWYVTPQSPGTCSITASQTGNSTWAAAISVTRTFTVLQTQTITFNPLGNVPLGAPPIALSAAASSGLPVMFTSNNNAICTVEELFINTPNGRQPLGWRVTLVATGLCSITAAQTGNAVYAPAAPVTETFTVQKTQTIKFLSLSGQLLAAGTVGVTATAISGMPVTFSSNSMTVCTVAQSTATTGIVTLLSTGTCSITVTQPGNTVYAAAAPVTQTFAVFNVGVEFSGIAGSASASFIPAIAFNPSLSVTAGKSNQPAFSLVLPDGTYTPLLIEAQSEGEHLSTVTVVVGNVATAQKTTYTYTGVLVYSQVGGAGQDTFTFTYNKIGTKTTAAALPVKRIH